MAEKLKTPVTASITEKKGKTEAKKNSTVIRKCICISEFQDKMYGKNMRVMNSSGTGYKCTVCGGKS